MTMENNTDGKEMAKKLDEFADMIMTRANSHCPDPPGSRLESVEAGIASFISMCNGACEARNKTCRSYLDRHRRCPECPKDWAEELQEHVGDEVRKLSEKVKDERKRGPTAVAQSGCSSRCQPENA